jgi:solute carrier family 25 oxoglutarate transporter 11
MNLASAVAAASGGVKSKSLSFPSYLSMMVKEQGAMSLYSGLSAGLLRQLFYTTSRLGLFEVFRDELAKYRPTDIWSRLSTGNHTGDCRIDRIDYIFSFEIKSNDIIIKFFD